MILDGRFAIITGCNRGIGYSIMKLFLEEGCNIIACVREYTNHFESQINDLSLKYGRSIFPIYFDLDDSQQIKNAIKEIHSLKVNVDILVNNSGVASGGVFQMTTILEMEKVMKINYFSQLLFTQGIVKFMIKNGNGSIINITSIAGLRGDVGTLCYGASKAAMNFATKVLAAELGNFNIRVNSIAPNVTNTDMLCEMSAEGKNILIQNSALKRIAEPIEIAQTALFLASDNSRYISGQILRVDGGVI